MAKLTKPKYIKISDIQKLLKYMCISGKRPHYVQFIQKPKRIAVIHLCDIQNQEKNTIYPEKDKRSDKNENLTPFEAKLDSLGYLRAHINENISIDKIFENILKCADARSVSLSVITPENLKLIEKHDILHLFSYSNFIKSQTEFDRSVFNGYSRPKIISPYFLIAVDCEMMECAGKIQVGRVSLLDHTGTVIYDQFIKPENNVTDYLEKYSGLNAENTGQGITLERLKEDLLMIIGTNTFLLGHGLENDLEALSIYTENVIDTSYLFLNSEGYKLKLSQLMKIHLDEEIQAQAHCSCEDALSCLKLLAYRISQLKNFLDPNGNVIDLRVEPKKLLDLRDMPNKGGLFFHEYKGAEFIPADYPQDIFMILMYQIDQKNFVAFLQKSHLDQ